MGGAVGQTSLLASFTEPSAEITRRERTPRLRHEKCHVVRRRISENRSKLWRDLNVELRARLLLAHMYKSVPDVLPPHSNHIAHTLARAEQQCERKPRLGTDLMSGLELRDFGFGPRMNAAAIRPNGLHLRGRIVLAKIDFTACVINARSALRKLFAAEGFRASISLTTCSRPMPATGISP